MVDTKFKKRLEESLDNEDLRKHNNLYISGPISYEEKTGQVPKQEFPNSDTLSQVDNYVKVVKEIIEEL